MNKRKLIELFEDLDTDNVSLIYQNTLEYDRDKPEYEGFDFNIYGFNVGCIDKEQINVYYFDFETKFEIYYYPNQTPVTAQFNKKKDSIKFLRKLGIDLDVLLMK